MKVNVTHPKTGKTIQVEVDKVTAEWLAEQLTPHSSLGRVQQQVDNLPYSRNVKVILGELATLTLNLGGVVLHVGHKFLELVFALPNRTGSPVCAGGATSAWRSCAGTASRGKRPSRSAVSGAATAPATATVRSAPGGGRPDEGQKYISP